MAVTLSITTPAVTEPFHRRTVTGAGLTASTAYIMSAVHPSGNRQRVEVTTDGSGGFTFPFVFQERGTVTFTIRPRTEWEGTTTTLTTTTATVQ